jgi:hypothetical protein
MYIQKDTSYNIQHNEEGRADVADLRLTNVLREPLEAFLESFAGGGAAGVHKPWTIM